MTGAASIGWTSVTGRRRAPPGWRRLAGGDRRVRPRRRRLAGRRRRIRRRRLSRDGLGLCRCSHTGQDQRGHRADDTNDATRTPRHAAPHNETPHCDPTCTVAEGVRAVRPANRRGGSSQHSTPNPHDPNAVGHATPTRAYRRAAPATTRRSRPLGGGILPELPRGDPGVFGCAGEGPLLLGVGGKDARVRRLRRVRSRAIAGGIPRVLGSGAFLWV